MKTTEKKPVPLPYFKRNNLVEMVFTTLKENILSGKFQEGDLLPTQEILARQFGVSRTVMREALYKLSSLGLVESHQGRGTFVRSPNVKTVMEPMFHALQMDEISIAELMEARYYLERILVRLATQRIQSPQILRLRENVSFMEQSVREGKIELFARQDLEFHLMLANIANNTVFMRVIETLREMMAAFFERFSQTPGVAERAVEYHQKILRAVVHKDPDQAEHEMQQHILDVIRMLRQHYQVDINLNL